MGLIEKDFPKYKFATKPFYIEEPFDFFFYRPCAYFLLMFVSRIPLHPNHFSMMALICGLSAGVFLAMGTDTSSIAAGGAILLFSIFDCCDGMLSRIKGNGSQYGELVDMLVDLVANVAIFIGLYSGLMQTRKMIPIHYLVIPAAITILIHASLYRFYKEQISYALDHNARGRKKKINHYATHLKNIKEEKGHFLDKLMLRLYLIFCKFQRKDKDGIRFNLDKYAKYNKPILPLWGVIAGSSHLTVLSLALIFHQIGFYFIFSVLLSNLWMIFLIIIQMGVNNSLREAD